MNLLDLLKILNEHHIQIGIENDQLKVTAAKGAMTKELMQLLKEHKEPLLAWATERHQQQDIPAIIPRSREQKIPLSFNQQGLWFIYQLAPETASYNMPMALRLKGALNLPAFNQAMVDLLNRHEVFRTHLISDKDQVFQQVLPTSQWTQNCETIQHEEDISTLVEQEALTPFQLENASLFRTRLWQLSKSDHVFMVTLHHIVADAGTVQILLADLAALYSAHANHQAANLPPLAFQYADYAEWQHSVVAPQLLPRQLAYWKQQLQDAPALLNIPTDQPRIQKNRHRAATLTQTLSSTLAEQAKTFALKNNITPFMLFLAVQQLLLSRHAQQDDICIAVPISGRHHQGTENIAGFFINTLVMRNQLHDNPSVAQYLSRTREMVLGAFSHQDAPLDKIIDALQLPRNANYAPLVQIGFNFLNSQNDPSSSTTLNIDKLSIEIIGTANTDAKYDMIWGINDNTYKGESQLTLSVEYNTDLFYEITVSTFIQQYCYLLEQCISNTNTTINALDLVNKDQLFDLLHLDKNKYIDLLPLTPMQRDIYLDTVINPDNRRNYFGWSQIIDTAIAADLLQQAINIITAHYSNLRLRIVNSNCPYLDYAYAAILQAESANAINTIRVLDWQQDKLSAEQAAKRCHELAFSKYDLTNEANIRFYLITLSASQSAIVITAHHTCMDGISLQAITQAYTEVYTALVEQRPYQLNADHFADYVYQQRQHCNNAESYAYWQALAKNCDAPSTHHLSAASNNTNDIYQSIHIDDSREHYANILQFCKTHNTSPAVYIKALYSLMIQSLCYTDNNFYFTDILAARPKNQATGIGCYFEQRPTVIDATVIHKDATFTQLINYLTNHRNNSRDKSISNSLIERLFPQALPRFMFNFYLTQRHSPFLDTQSFTTLLAPEMDNAVNLITIVDNDHLHFNLTWMSAQFTPHQFIERLLHLSQQILSGTQCLAELSLQLPNEQSPQAQTTNVNYQFTTVADAIFAQAQRSPNVIAIKDKTRSLSFIELDQAANQLARYLQQNLAIRAGQNIVLCLSPNCDFVIALLASIKLGGCYIPIDPNYPTARIQHILNDAKASCIISEQCTAAHLANIQTPTLFIDSAEIQQQLSGQNNTAITVDINIDAPLYTIYTSGSTGLPKGATVKQRGELNLLQWYQREFALQQGDNVLLISALGFDLTQKNILGPLISGATLVLPELNIYDPQAVLAIIQQENISFINCAPSAFYPLAENSDVFSKLSSLRLVLFGGEAIRIQALLAWLEHPLCHAQLVNMYGPTECTDIASFYRIEQPHLFTQAHIPIGHANDNVQLYIVDSSLRQLPKQVVGELLVGGEGVGLGYQQLPDLTQEKFIHHPTLGYVYRTGDLVIQQEDGELVFVGRIDHQVKLRGLRIELGEIEFALRQITGVKDSLALVIDDKLTAYILTNDGKTPDDWRTVLQRYLPEYMLPQGIAALHAWPLSANGKIDRKALPALNTHHTQTYVAPRNTTEETLVQIWQDILGTEPIGIYDSFFELGGHSLLAVRAVARIRDTFKQELPLRDLFYTPTISAIAERLQQSHQQDSLPAITAVNRETADQRFPLSFAQQRLWFIDQLTPNSAAYNMPFALKISGELNLLALQQSFAALLTRHEVLRTRIDTERGQAWQVIDVSLDSDITLTSINTDNETLQQYALDFLSKPFNLHTGPLVRAQLLEEQNKNSYVLLLCLHHIIADGWTIEVLIRDLFTLYLAYSQNETVSLEAPSLHYIDYTLWQRQYLEGERLQTQIQYWQQQLAGAEPLELVTDFPRPAYLSAEGKQFSFTLSHLLTERLQQYCQENGLTPFMLLLGTFQLLLSKYSGQEDISIGTPIANRPISALENMAGLFVNTLVIRSLINAENTLHDFFEQVKHTCLAAYQHQDIPFELLVDELHIPRELSQTPLFQAMFVMQQLGQGNTLPTGDIANLTIENLLSSAQANTAKFDITLNIINLGDGLQGVIEYRSQLFTENTIQAFAEHYIRLLQTVLKAPADTIANLSLLTEAEILHATSLPVATTHSETNTIIQWLEKIAAKTPLATAVIFAEESLSYAELNEKSNALAQTLLAANISSNNLVGLYQHRSLEMIASMLAVLKIGAAYVPIDPDHPEQRISDIAEEAQLSCILTTLSSPASTLAHIPHIYVDIKNINRAENLTTMAQANSLAYVLFTSGSTGKPKGVMIEHAALLNHMQWMLNQFHFSANDKTLQKTPYVFDASVWEFYAPLLCGGTLVIAEPEAHKSPKTLAALIHQHKITVAQFVPSLLEVFLQHADMQTCHSLQQVFCGGEPLSPTLVNNAYKALPNVSVINLYGPTETTIDASFAIIKPNAKKISIGKPIDQLHYFVLDQQQNLLPDGLPGELYIAGKGLARGYLHQPDLTAASFIHHHFANQAAIRLYKTGDRVRRLANGDYDYLGRIDQQVKIRGQRIELGDIENQLVLIAGIAQAAVIAREDKQQIRLAAFYTATESNISLSSAALRLHLQHALPDYMIPSVFIELPQLPTTHNGKLDKKALANYPIEFSFTSDFVAPRNDIEHKIVTLWMQLLNVSPIGVNDNFFELGGHSLIAIRVCAELEELFDRQLPVRILFEHPTVAELAQFIQHSPIYANKLPNIISISREQDLPLSFNQQGLYFIYQLAPEAASYNIPMALRLQGNLDLEVLEQAVNRLFARHEILRTAIIENNGVAYQHIQNNITWQATVITLENSTNIEQLIKKEAQTPFDLATAPLLRLKLWQTNAEEYLATLTLHHIIADAVSLQTLIAELAALYDAIKNSKPLALPSLSIQYADYAWWQQNVLMGDALNAQLHYWQQQLHQAPALLKIATDKPRTANTPNTGALFSHTLSSTLVNNIRALAVEQRLTPFMILLGAQQLLLGKHAKQDDICIATPIAGRHNTGTEHIPGYFINALIMRNRFSDNPSVAQFLRNTKDMVLAAFAHQDAPLDKVLEQSHVARSPLYAPIAQIGFNYITQRGQLNTIQLDDLSITAIDQTSTDAKYDMIWAFADTDDSIHLTIEYKTALFNPSTIETFFNHYQYLLGELLTSPNAPVLTLSLLSNEALQQTLHCTQQIAHILPLTPMQRDIYLDTLINPENRRNYFGWTQVIPRNINPTILQQALNTLTAQYSSLRMRIIASNKEYLDIAYSAILASTDTNAHNPLHYIDWSNQELDDKTLVKQCNELAFKPYDLANEPNLRFYCVKANNNRYAIVLTAHHACIDGVSLQAITELYTQLYIALEKDHSITLPNDIYPDFVQQQRQLCDNFTSVDFWRTQAQGCDGLHSRITHKPEENTYHSEYFDDSTEHWQHIREYCQTHQIAPALYIKALYALILQSLCYADNDFYFIDVLAARPREHNKAIGCYFEQRPTVIPISAVNGNASFSDLLDHLEKFKLESRNKSISNAMIEQLFSRSSPQFLFNFYLTERYLPFDDVTSTTTIIAPEMDNAVSFIAVVDHDRLQFNLTWMSQQFDASEFIKRLLHLSQQVLSGVTQLAHLQLLLPDEQPQTALITKPNYIYQSVIQAIEQQVNLTPEAIATKDLHQQLDYQTLNRKANKLAHYLASQHAIKKGDNIALCLDANSEFLIALLACLKCGAAYIPVDPQYPSERIKHILADAQASCVISQICYRNILANINTQSIFIDNDAAAIATHAEHNLNVSIDLNDTLYTIYTSGSTGLPKGASVSQRGELNLLAWYKTEFSITNKDNVLVISALGFDLTQKNLLAPLYSGATVIFPELDIYDPEAIAQIINDQAITFINCAPSAFYPLVNKVDYYALLHSLRLVLFGGESIRIQALLEWLEHSSCQAQIINMYGPTECTDIASFYRIEQPHLFTHNPIPIGHANDNVQLFVVDSQLRLLPKGRCGELLVGGEGVGLGYLQLPELTQEKFIDHPIAGKVYRTGDLVTQQDDNEYVFIGRIDHQVKLRGLRIELGEIEYALKQLNGVSDSVVIVNDEKLCAYIINAQGEIPSQWRTLLSTSLPSYMMPQSLVALTVWPLSANGKIDRKALMAIDAENLQEKTLPQTTTEKMLAEIWQEVLGINNIGINENFFELGGHSLLIVRAVTRMRDQFGKDIPLRDVFFTPTIAALSRYLDAQQHSTSIVIEKADRSQCNNKFPLSFAQQRIFLLEQIQHPSAMYNIGMALQLNGNIDIGLLSQSVNLLVQRHESLRTQLHEENGESWQYLTAAQNITLSIEQAVSRSVFEQAITTALLLPFNLQDSPLFRAKLITLTGTNEAALLLVTHHIISDGLSTTILLNELAIIYKAISENQTALLAPLPIQYIDYAIWQQTWLNEERLNQQLHYWQQQLANAPLLALPLDRPRKPNNSTEGATLSFMIPEVTVVQLQQLAQRQQATPFMLLITAWTILLHRYVGQDDISIGTPVANRPHASLESLIGFFVNTLVIRNNIDGQASFIELLEQVKHTTLDAYTHQDLPFERLLDELDIQRDLSHSPLFQTFFSFQTADSTHSDTTITINNTEFSSWPNNTANIPAKFDLSLGVITQQLQWQASFEYRTALFEQKTISTLAEHFLQLLNSIIASPNETIASLNFISEEERALQLHDWNNTYTEHNTQQHIIALFEQHANEKPNAIAVTDKHNSLTYEQFNQQVNQLCHYLLTEKSLTKNAKVVICHAANSQFLIAVYAVIKAGACYIPIDANYPDDRINYIVQNSAADLILCDETQANRFSQHKKLVNLATEQTFIKQQASTNPNTIIEPTTPLYMIYTSGSTGLPKGVEVIHQGETNLIHWYIHEFDFTATDKFLIISASGFDLTQKNFFAPLCSGGQIVFPNKSDYDPEHIGEIISQQGITVINCAPSALYPLINDTAQYQKLNSLRLALLGGEPIRRDITLAWLSATQFGCELVNMYGPTECTDISTIYRIRGEEDFSTTLPIGKPIANTQCYILDKHQQLLPIGLVGELYVAGEGVSNGYIKQMDLQAKAFFANPFNAGTLMYKTGDLVRYHHDGNIEYLGRNDHQVKIRGLRIELEEIEVALLSLNPIDQALVMAIEHDNEPHLVAYYSESNDYTEWLPRTELAKLLPDYMVPQFFIPIKQWPLSPNGKINRHALPKPEWQLTQRNNVVHARNAIEQQLVLIWQDILKQAVISIDDNFFSLGGHSLKAVQVGAKLRAQFTIDLALRDLFEAPTIAELALLIEQRLQNNTALQPITKTDRTQRLPLSFAQQRLWFLSVMDNQSAAYNMPAAFIITGSLNVSALMQAFAALIQRHEVFRTRFINTYGEPEQYIDQESLFAFQQTTLQEDVLKTHISEFTQRAFDLASEHLLRAELITLEHQRFALLINMHHIIADAWSINVLVRELGVLYASFTTATPNLLTALPLQYADYAAWQRNYLQGDALQKEIDYWKTTLQGVPLLLNMPLDKPRPAMQSTHGALYKTHIDAALAANVRKLALQEQATVFMTYLSAYQVLLHKYTHQHDICVGIPLAGRSLPGVQDLIGFFINALAIRTPLHANLSMQEIIASVKEITLQAFAHDQLPVEMLINELDIKRNLSYTPVIQCAFNMMSVDDALLPEHLHNSFNDIAITAIESEALTAKFEILFTLVDTGTDIHLSVEYNTDIYIESTIATLAKHYIDILNTFVTNPEQRLDEVQLGEFLLDTQHQQALALTPMQRDIYLASLAKPDTLENSLGFAFHMPFAVDTNLWQSVLKEITTQHTMLRADLVANKMPYQDIAYFAITEDNDIDLHILDWSNESLSQNDIQLRLDQLVYRHWDLKQSSRVCHHLIKISAQHFCATLAAHHMVLDGFAAVLIGTWITELYEQRIKGDVTPFASNDYFSTSVIEQRAQFDQPETLSYWRKKMATAVGLQTTQGAGEQQELLSLPIPVDHYKAVRALCKTYKITPSLYFKCLFTVLIQAYTRAEGDFVITEFQAGRNKINKDSLGCLYHTNPSFIDLTSLQGSIEQLFAAAREQQKASKDFLQISHLTQMQLLPKSQIYFSYNYLLMPHFSTMLGETLNGTRYTPNAEGSVDLRVQAFGDELCLWLAYHSSKFEDHQFLDRLLHLSQQLVASNISHTQELSLLLNNEALTISNKKSQSLELLPLTISLQSLQQRHNIAVINGETQLSYAALEQQSNALAQQLLQAGINTGDRIGICIGKRVELLVAILATIKVRACYVPMDVNYPADRLAYMLDDCQAALVITESCMLATFTSSLTPLLNIDTVDLSVNAALPKVQASLDDLLYMIYTSGSTGKPKGATVVHRSEANLLAWYTQEFAFSAADKTLIISAIGFDLTQKNLFALLTVGGTVVFPDTEHFDVNAILACIEREAITIINCAPSALYALIELGGKKALQQLRSLRTVLLGGEPIHLSRLSAWISSAHFNCAIVNMYGPTECTDISTFHTLSADTLRGLAQLLENNPYALDIDVPLGKPNAGVNLVVLNEQLQAVPQGLVGELCISGISVGAGYWNKPELTATAFINNPFSTGDDDTVLYKTGDLVRVNPADGLLYYVGRKDFQVKLRGLRIELGEVEHALRRIPAIDDILTLVDNEQLLAFALTDAEHHQHGIEGWRESLLGQLPDYMVPALLITLTAWPLTPNGKIDRQALLALDRSHSSTQFVAPRTDIEKDIATLWQEVLGIGEAGVFDNFFEAGGDSLAAVRLVAGLEIRFNTKLPVSSLFGAQTIAQLAHIIHNQLAQWSPIVPIQPQGHKTPIFAVHAIGALVLSYEPLARALGKDQPFFGIQAYGFEENQTPYTDLNEMLEFYVAAILQQQPHGPYQLIGHSFGGILALEIARKLQSLGETINYVGLLDTHMPIEYANAAVDDAMILKTFAEHNFGVVNIPLRSLRLMKPELMIKTVAERFNGMVSEEFIRSAIAIIRGFQRMMIGFVMQPLNNIPVVLVTPEDLATKTRGLMLNLGLRRNIKTRGFEKITNNITVHQVSGDHHSMLKVVEGDELAALLTLRLKEKRGDIQ